MDEITESRSSSRSQSKSQAGSAANEVHNTSDVSVNDSDLDQRRPELLRAELSEDEEKMHTDDLAFEDLPAARAATQKQGARRINRLRQ